MTKRLRDRGRFKVPSLRNVGLRTRFMHNGQMRELDDVVQFYRRPPNNGNLDPILRGGLSIGGRVGTITDFLQNALTDPRVKKAQYPFDRPKLASERTTEK